MSEKRDGEHSMERLGFLAAMSRLPDQFRASAELSASEKFHQFYVQRYSAAVGMPRIVVAFSSGAVGVRRQQNTWSA
jgi:hypothetical protein